MKRNYNLSQQLVAYLLLISVCLQSCSHSLNPPIARVQESIEKTQELTKQTAINQLVDKELTAEGGHAVTFYEEVGELKANVAINAPQGFSKTYEGLSVAVEQGAELPSMPQLHEKAQQRRIHLQPANAGKPAKIVIYKGAGLAGGGKYRKPNKKGKAIDSLKDWAPTYEFYNSEKKWKEQLGRLAEWKNLSIAGYVPIAFYSDPDFLDIYRPILNSNVRLVPEHVDDPLVGILWFKTLAKRIGLAPIKQAYSDQEIKFLKRQMLAMAMSIQGQANDFKWVSHNLRDLSKSAIEKADKKLNDQEATPEEKTEALKKKVYASIPWRQLEGLGKFADKLGKNNYVVDEIELFKKELPNLIQDFRTLTNQFNTIIRFYQKQNNGTLEWNFPVPAPKFTAIYALGSFVRDKNSLQKIEKIINNLIVNKSESKSLTYRYALLRVLSIIGECKVTISPVTRDCLLTKDMWHILKNIRNGFHKYKFQKQLHDIILNLDDDKIVLDILQDFELLIQKIESEGILGKDNWEKIKRLYNNSSSNKLSNLQLNNIVTLYESINSKINKYQKLSDQEIEQLIESTKNYLQPSNEALEYVKETLLREEKIDREAREYFLANLDKLNPSKSIKRTLAGAYGKICKAEKEEGEAEKVLREAHQELEESKENIKEAEEKLKKAKEEAISVKNRLQENIKDAFKRLEENRKLENIEADKLERLEKVAKNIRTYQTWMSLKIALNEVGLTSKEGLNLWEKYHIPVESISRKQKEGHLIKARIDILCKRIQNVLKGLDSIFSKYRNIPFTKRIDTFIEDSITALAMEYLVGCFRENAQQLHDILLVVNANKNKKVLLANKVLEEYINRAKAILHNHDITAIDSLTGAGTIMAFVLADIPLLFGDLLDVEFVLNNAKVNVTLDNGYKASIPVIDDRRIHTKKSRKRRIKKRNNPLDEGYILIEGNYPILKSEDEAAARIYLKSFQGKGFRLGNLHDNLSLTSRYLLFTPPKKPDNILAVLNSLISSKDDLFEHKGINLEGEEILFEEVKIAADNDCALHCLGLSRQEAMQLLLAKSPNDKIRNMVADEIFEALREGTIPQQMRDQAYNELRKRYFAVYTEIGTLVSRANNELKVAGQAAQQLLSVYPIEDSITLTSLKQKMEALDDVEKEILTYASNEETFKKFVKFHVGKTGTWLTYIRGTREETRTTSLDAIAQLKGIKLTIWIKDEQDQNLRIVHTFNEEGNNQIDMLHVTGLTHFNLLKRK
ncbi:hypothetical protein Aasi_1894 [Candidatus Amoebophilus asiaticus 5a2]|uniref:Uncharacterized protein n=1 Tax=Amoebophilus asiaticus (strain 5a2) TaxID=452471 RepID=C3L475_AMOA5|nr:hypothetical protein [Candidatus Amoebophilus asiaticus]ACP21116.1 hypothetical protein Aasi_1894 [Candidatus Amoebophilus asiaticus 5a2]